MTDPLGLGVASITWEQNIVFSAGTYAGGQESVTARNSFGTILAQLITTFVAPNNGDTDISVGSSSGAFEWNASGSVLRDTVTGDTTLEDAFFWLSDAAPDPLESKEECHVSGGKCWCQCTTDWPWDHAICAGAKIAAAISGYEVETGWWYEQNGVKCPG